MTLQFEKIGAGPSRVIVLHDWSQDNSSNDPIKCYLNHNEFTFIFADIRGYGKSKSQNGKYTIDEVVSDIAHLADSLAWPKFSLVGHSMTGMVAQKVMVDIPSRLERVILTAAVPASGLNTDEETYGFFKKMVTDDETFKEGMKGLTSFKYGNDWGNYKLSRNRATVSPDAMAAYCRMWARTNFADQMKNLSTPVLAIFGKHDNEALRIEALGDTFSRWFPSLSAHICDCGHYPMQETPVEYAHIIQRYLQSK